MSSAHLAGFEGLGVCYRPWEMAGIQSWVIPCFLSVPGHAHTSRRSPQKLSQTFRGSQGFVAKAKGNGKPELTITAVGEQLGEPPVGSHLQNSNDFGSELLWQWWIGCCFNIPAGGTRSAWLGCESTLSPSSMQMLQYIVIHLHRFLKFQKPSVSIINLARQKYCFFCGIAVGLQSSSQLLPSIRKINDSVCQGREV